MAHCADLREARAALTGMNLTGTPFSETLPPASLHWLIADASGAIVVESMADGLHIYDDPVGILTNNPPFPQQMAILNRYRGLSPPPATECLCPRGGAALLQPWHGCQKACPAICPPIPVLYGPLSLA